ncbi:MAG: MBL fold metallo-hydrolase [Defluviitaleaceae bacterium]|nr:MBL fold metallo-hydrolase [Defluviitaleaceae bacterium]
MKKQELAEGIVHYIFEPQPDRHYATSVTAIFNGNKVLLIDTAYEFQMAELLEDFQKNNFEVEQVIITHFHDDHMEGLKSLPEVPVYGSGRFKETLDMWTPKEEHVYFTPSIVVDESFSFSYGEYDLTLIPFPGHSACGMLVKIDNQFLHVVDEVMFSIDGVPMLPSSDGNDMKRHLDSLDRLRSYEGFVTLIPSHGPVFDGAKLLSEIENRYSYLKEVHDSDEFISYEDATKECTCTFVHSEWHEDNLNKYR